MNEDDLRSAAAGPEATVGSTRGLRVLVVGSDGGIGRALVAGLLADGARVVLADLDASSTSSGAPDAPAVPMDVTRPDSVRSGVEAAVAVYGGLDALLHVSGVTGNVPFLELDLDEWRRVLAVNLDGPFLVGRAVTEQLVAQGTGGSLTFVTSQLAGRPFPGKTHYAASKAGLETLVRGMAVELSPHGIRVNALAPGVTATRMALDRLERSEAAMEWTLGHIPLGRLADPQELVAPALLLVGTGGRYITGTTITVDGGYLLR
jgi:NAD(P)-dependent dehydrogenase (short-subunit alcohol dehydrogenase family)